ncbi:MarR family transcriptional regulator [Streptomyces sp. AC536]|nr:MarR family transcriptional regulator [Streptomyces buecherae]QNJ41230.1 MarR family transcriptional regulator [Streptomyces buecherae]
MAHQLGSATDLRQHADQGEVHHPDRDQTPAPAAQRTGQTPSRTASPSPRSPSADGESAHTGESGPAPEAERDDPPAPPGRALAHSWCALSALHSRLEAHIERALEAAAELSVREYSVLDVLSEQHDGEGGHLRMNQLADVVVLSQSATTRLVSRLEERGLLVRYLCPTDRRGIYTDVSDDGRKLLERARPVHDAALREALQEAAKRPELAPLVTAVRTLGPASKPV